MKRLFLAGALCLCFSNTVFADCFAEGDKVIAEGVLKQEIYPGPPNYESVADGDKPESVWVVDLDGEVTCATGAPDWGSRKKMQVIPNSINVAGFENKHISMSGSLVYAETGHHHTPLLVDATSIEKSHQNRASALPTDENLKPGQMTAETACIAYVGMVDQTYMYVSSEEYKYAANAVKLAEALYLSPEYVDFMVRGMQTNRRDFANGQYIHSLLQSKDQRDMAIMGCLMAPDRTIPNWNALIQHNLIVTTN